MKLTSTLDKITEQVFGAKTCDEAKQIVIAYLNESKIKETDRIKMIDEITSMKYLHKVQIYIANALLKYEGLGVGIKPTSSSANETKTEE